MAKIRNTASRPLSTFGAQRPPIKLPKGWGFIADKNEFLDHHHGYAIFDGAEPDLVNVPAGDYSVRGPDGRCYTDMAVVERKSLPNLISDVGGRREQLGRCLEKMSKFVWPAVVIESDWDLAAKPYVQKSRPDGQGVYNRTSPNAVVGSVIAWAQRFRVPFYFTSNRLEAERVTRWILTKFAHEVENGSLEVPVG